MLTLREQLEYAWAAGFIDGDGCFLVIYSKTGINKPRDYSKPQRIILTAAQVRIEPLLRLQNLLGGSTTGPYKHGGFKAETRQPVYHYRLGSKLLKIHIKYLWPHLSRPKKEQYLEKQQAIRDKVPSANA